MGLAICIYCGNEKLGALSQCNACGRTPSGLDNIARSITLSDRHTSAASLQKAKQLVVQRQPWYDIPEVKGLIESYIRDRVKLREVLRDERISNKTTSGANHGVMQQERSSGSMTAPPKADDAVIPFDGGESRQQDWSTWLKTLIAVASFFLPLFGLFIGTIGMLLRDNYRQCKSIWITSGVGLCVWTVWLAGNTDLNYPGRIGFLVMGSVLLMGLSILPVYLSMRRSRKARLAATVLAGVMLIGLTWWGFAMTFNEASYMAEEEGRYSDYLSPWNAVDSSAAPSVAARPTPHDPVVDEILTYFNDFIPRSTVLESKSLDAWAMFIQNDTPVWQVADAMERQIIPDWQAYINFLHQFTPADPDLRSFHQDFTGIAYQRLAAFESFVRGVRTNDPTAIMSMLSQFEGIDAKISTMLSRKNQLLLKHTIPISMPEVAPGTAPW